MATALVAGCLRRGPPYTPIVLEEGEKTATIAWDAPTKNEDGTELKDLAGYKLHWGKSSREYEESRDVGLVTEGKVVYSETTYVAATAYDDDGNESELSEELVIEP